MSEFMVTITGMSGKCSMIMEAHNWYVCIMSAETVPLKYVNMGGRDQMRLAGIPYVEYMVAYYGDQNFAEEGYLPFVPEDTTHSFVKRLLAHVFLRSRGVSAFVDMTGFLEDMRTSVADILLSEIRITP